MAKQIIFFCTDPTQRVVRITVMIMLAPIAFQMQTRVSAVRIKRARNRNKCAGENMGKAPDSDDPDWGSVMHRIAEARDIDSFSAVFRHFAPRLTSFLMRSGATRAEAEEVTQDVMTVLWQKAHLFDPRRASLSTWIFAIARNRQIDRLRKERRPEPQEVLWGPEQADDNTEAMIMKQDTAHLTRALTELPEKQRKLIERAFFGDLSHSDIARETGLPLGTIKSRIRLALERLRHSMRQTTR